MHGAHPDCALVEMACDVSGSTTEIAGNTRVAHALGKPVEQSTIYRLVLQLVVDAPGILVRYQVIAGCNVADLLVNHLCVNRILFSTATCVGPSCFLDHRLQGQVL